MKRIPTLVLGFSILFLNVLVNMVDVKSAHADMDPCSEGLRDCDALCKQAYYDALDRCNASYQECDKSPRRCEKKDQECRDSANEAFLQCYRACAAGYNGCRGFND